MVCDMNLNFSNSGHTAKSKEGTPILEMKAFPPFIAPTYSLIEDIEKDPKKQQELRIGNYLFDTLTNARRYLDVKVQKHPPCNECFRRLPGKRSFKEVYNDPDVWVNYADALEAPPWGFTEPGTKEIAIHARSLSRGYLWVAATMVHEMAHVNGASGRSNDNSAEQTLKFCLLAPLFDPKVFGLLKDWQAPDQSGTAYA